MSTNRREFLQSLLNSAIRAGGTLVVATAAIVATQKEEASTDDVQNRAAKLPTVDAEGADSLAWVNGAFRKGAFVNGGGFHNGGGFKNAGFVNGGGFHNGGGGGFKNAGFANGGGGGGFRNGSFRNY